MLLNAIEQFLPAGLAGAAFTAVIVKYSPDQLWLLPGVWQLLLSLGIFAAARSLTRAVNIVAGWYFLCGITVLILCATDQQLSPWYMGIPFAIGQFAAAVILKIINDDRADEH